MESWKDDGRIGAVIPAGLPMQLGLDAVIGLSSSCSVYSCRSGMLSSAQINDVKALHNTILCYQLLRLLFF